MTEENFKELKNDGLISIRLVLSALFTNYLLLKFYKIRVFSVAPAGGFWYVQFVLNEVRA